MKKSSLLLPAECLPLEEQKIFVACSGGLDSMVLLDLLTRNNYQPTVLHVNYKLRGEESDLDQKLVEKYCLEHQLSNHIYQTNDSEVKALKSGNLQEKARTIRYTFFEKHLLVKANSLLYLGHHLDDQIETFFMRVLRKSGLTGMQLMKLKMDYKIRPFLNYHKEDLLLYAQEYQVP
jgi:tRNA(Ile)-lysidine synthase